MLPALIGVALASLSYRAGVGVETAETLQRVVRQPVTLGLRDLVAPFVAFSGLGYLLPIALLAAAATERTLATRRWLWGAVGLWVVLYAGLPTHGYGLAFAAQRVPIWLWLCVALSIPEGHRRASLAAALVCFGTIATSLPGAVAWGARVHEAREAFGPPVGITRYSVLVDSGDSPAAPHANLFIGVASYAGGVGSAAFNVNPIRDAVCLTDAGRAARPPGRRFTLAPACPPSPQPCAPYQAGLAREVALAALRWDSVVAIGHRAPFGDTLQTHGYRQQSPGRWVPRPASIALTLPRPCVEPLVLQVRWEGFGPIAQSPLSEGSADLGPLPAGAAVLAVGSEAGQLLHERPIRLSAGERLELELPDLCSVGGDGR